MENINLEEPLPLSEKIIEHYNEGNESKRLFSDAAGQLELIRTQDLILQHLQNPPAVILDIGGGPGVYTNWLLSMGYDVHLVDPVPLHIEQAQSFFRKNPSPSDYSATLGDARSLTFDDGIADAVLLMGPLYHLEKYNDRINALKEAWRVLRPGGLLFAVGISKFASAFDGLFRNLFDDPAFIDIVHNDLKDGHHRNPNNTEGYFTTAFFHHPKQLQAEIESAAFQLESLVGIEGIGWLVPDLAKYMSHEKKDFFLNLLTRLEKENTLLGLSAHMMAVARKPAV
jgi:ubiquinone/menaquinone biosynthesis C-methylase UbiE